MKPEIQFRLSQHLALTPQLQQSIRLLQLSTLELQQEVAQAVSLNPLLENDEDWITKPLRVTADGSLIALAPATSTMEPGEPLAPSAEERSRYEYGEQGETRRDLNNLANDNSDERGWWNFNGLNNRGSRSNAEDDDMPLQLPETQLSLREHLLMQLRLTQANMRDRALITYLIESLDDDGYLPATLEDIINDLPPELDITLEEINTALTLLHSFDPPGVGARSAAECLKLQLLRLEDTPTRTLALEIVTRYLAQLAARDFTALRKQLKVGNDPLRDAYALIRSLEPFPGSAYSQSEADYLMPDVIVRKVAQSWQANLNPDIVPRLRINRLYANIVHSNRADSSVNSLHQQLQEARWLIKNIQQRSETILRVAQAIVERQKDFFICGETAMQPLVLREIADTLGLHESTVSRVTTSKYMLTPFGTLEFKYFFGSHVSTDTGDTASSTAIRAIIKQLIGAEDPQFPLSDSRIAALLAERGFIVARRTVAKYRETLKILPVNLRKSL